MDGNDGVDSQIITVEKVIESRDEKRKPNQVKKKERSEKFVFLSFFLPFLPPSYHVTLDFFFEKFTWPLLGRNAKAEVYLGLSQSPLSLQQLRAKMSSEITPQSNLPDKNPRGIPRAPFIVCRNCIDGLCPD